ncbi:DUF3224 domain-containing protein [Paludibaculum fermentans]|uniref:DUF3224 domain-containing protein n=1 Tax=Paludibaculum fermentans TaxID=1473598 RepID=UPI003EBC81AA
MQKLTRVAGVGLLALFLVLGVSNRLMGQAAKEKSVTIKISGPFRAKISPLQLEDKTEGTMLGRMAIFKTYEGDLAATARGEMLTAGTAVQGSAGYVAVERVTGTLKGKSGSFSLQHSGVMDRGAAQLVITVVPDSGTGELAGLKGKMAVRIEPDGKHFYDFEYTLP